MKQSRAAIARVIADKSLRRGSHRQLSNQIAAYLLSERRVGDLSSLMRDVQNVWAGNGRLEVIASSAHELSPSLKSHISRLMKRIFPHSKQIIVTEAHDPAVIGGVRLNLSNQQLDLSIKAKLNRFKQLTTAGKA